LTKGVPVQQLGHEETAPVVIGIVDDANDVGMVDRRQHGRDGAKAAAGLGVGDQRRVQFLDNDALAARVDGLGDRAPHAPPELAADVVPMECAAVGDRVIVARSRCGRGHDLAQEGMTITLDTVNGALLSL